MDGAVKCGLRCDKLPAMKMIMQQMTTTRTTRTFLGTSTRAGRLSHS